MFTIRVLSGEKMQQKVTREESLGIIRSIISKQTEQRSKLDDESEILPKLRECLMHNYEVYMEILVGYYLVIELVVE